MTLGSRVGHKERRPLDDRALRVRPRQAADRNRGTDSTETASPTETPYAAGEGPIFEISVTWMPSRASTWCDAVPPRTLGRGDGG